jgi:Ger(x)C family germination protein
MDSMKIRSLSQLSIILLILSGCSPDSRELDQRSMIVGMAVDKEDDKDGYFNVTIQIPNLGGAEKSPQTQEFETFTAKGESLWDALSEIETLTPTVLFFGHLKAVAISEKLAKEGLRPVIDFLDREASIANQILILIIKDQKAKEFVGTESPLVALPSLYLERFFRADQKLTRTQDIKLFEYRRDINTVSKSALLPIAISQDKKIIIQDMAVFNDHKMVAELSGPEVGISILLRDGVLQDKNKSTTIKRDDGKEVKVAFTRIELTRKISYKKTNPVQFDIKIKGKGQVIEVEEGKTTANFINKAEEQFIKDYKQDVQKTFEILQDLNVEPLLLGQKIWAYDHQYYKTLDWMKDGWKEAKFSISVDFEVDNTGQRGIYNKEILGR